MFAWQNMLSVSTFWMASGWLAHFYIDLHIPLSNPDACANQIIGVAGTGDPPRLSHKNL